LRRVPNKGLSRSLSETQPRRNAVWRPSLGKGIENDEALAADVIDRTNGITQNRRDK